MKLTDKTLQYEIEQYKKRLAALKGDDEVTKQLRFKLECNLKHSEQQLALPRSQRVEYGSFKLGG